ncbi:MAG TPA: hypothetical protein VEA80_10600 [Vitreimonas sp.]|uniref:hypothetical protein n=1 Tax=Vitreimonas sp. TaxID=3069702 RepID=UPI002D6F1946|nr:hypothetical protein [Vitreimonas sp.]HYD87915.1 hypothetical protein [Vitreimonas sp.]
MMHEPETIFRKSSLGLVDHAARGLGFFSLALGAAELAFPGAISRALGLKNQDGLLRAYGLREIASGLGALQPNPAPAVWSRVAGDALDLAMLAQGLSADNDKRVAAKTALAAVAAITVVDVVVGAMLSQQAARKEPPRDYSDRSGFPKGFAAAHGAAAGYRGPDFMRVPREGGGAPAQTGGPL